MVKETLLTWTDLLQLPFAERIFLDDQSPDCNALRALQNAEMLGRFDRVQYHSVKHAPHSNFGIVASLALADTPYIMHLDDDVHVTAPASACRDAIERALEVLERDQKLLGFNLLTLDPRFHGADWFPAKPYAQTAGLHHPRRYYGTAACIIRRELLEKVTFDEIVAWGDKQPNNWEKLVTSSPDEFITGDLQTPFGVPEASYLFRATAEVSKTREGLYLFKHKLKQLLVNSPALLRAAQRAAGKA